MKNANKKLLIFDTLRGKLSLWYFGSTLFVFLILSATLSGILWVTLHRQIDHHLLTVINEARQIVENNQGEVREELLKNLVSTQGMTVVLLTADGSPLIQTNSPDFAVISEHQIQQVVNSKDVSIDDPAFITSETVRFSIIPVMESGNQGTLAVGYSIQIMEDTFRKIIGLTTVMVFVFLVPLSIASYRILKRNLSPLEDIARVAKKVDDTKSLERRVYIRNASTEIKVIAKAFNQMLDKLQTSFEKEHQFFSDAAHTLKTPLAVLRSQIDDLAGIKTTQKKTLFKSIDNLSEVIGDLLLLSRIETKGEIEKETFSLTNVMKEFVELTQTLGLDKNLSVTSKIQRNVSVKANKRLIRRAIGNVVQNAVSYSKKDGRINLSLKKDKNGTVEIVVKDTGYGISKSDIAHVTKRFYRGKNKVTRGSGLGLAITKAIINGTGGKIKIKSKEGVSTEVKLMLYSKRS